MRRLRKPLSLLCSLLVIGLGLPLGMYYLSVWNMPRIERWMAALFADANDPGFALSYTVACGVASALAFLIPGLKYHRRRKREAR